MKQLSNKTLKNINGGASYSFSTNSTMGLLNKIFQDKVNKAYYDAYQGTVKSYLNRYR